MLDSHCHLDRYENPIGVAAEAARQRVVVIAVTSLPSHFRQGLPHVREFTHVKLGLGLHPLCALDHAQEWDLFRELLDITAVVGEVGLDFSREGRETRLEQMKSFRLVAELVTRSPKIVSLHSRGAESAVLDVLKEFRVPSAIFHWYSGPLQVLDEIVRSGHYFSVNPAMTRSTNGKRIIARIPPDRVLTETDGPYVMIGQTSAKPWDVVLVEEYLGMIWSIAAHDARSLIAANFRNLLRRLDVPEEQWSSYS